MTPAELERIGKRIYGRFRWRSRLALNLGIDIATVHRWGKRDKPLSYIAEVAVRGLLEAHRVNVAREKAECEKLRKAGKLRPKLKTRRKKRDRPKTDLVDAADCGDPGVPAGDRTEP